LTSLVISEIQYAPHAAVAELEQGDFAANDFEFLEFLNASDAPFNLSGLRLAQVPLNGTPQGVNFAFPARELQPGQRVVVARSVAAFQARFGNLPSLLGEWSGGSLSNQGETITIVDGTNAVVHQVTYDSNADWPFLADGRGASLDLIDPTADPNAPANWRSSMEYGGSPGQAPTLRGPRVLINEVLSHTDEPLFDSIELHNVTNTAIDIGGWYLSDRVADPIRYTIPAGTRIPAGGYVVFDERQFNPGQGTLPRDFGISEYGEDLYLFSPRSNRVPGFIEDMVIVGATDNGVSVGNILDVRDGRELLRLESRSLGQPNGRHEVSPVVISEVHFHPPDDDVYKEFVELQNVSSEPIDIGGWEIVDAVELIFPPNVILPPGGTAVLVAFDPQDTARTAEFRSHYGIDSSVRLLGPWSTSGSGEPSRLSNSGETVSLRYPILENGIPYYALSEFVTYRDADPWPAEPDGQGASLVRADARLYSNDPDSWVAGHPSPGNQPFRASTAELLEEEQTSTGNIGTDGVWVRGATDVDFFRFLPPEDGEYVFRTTSLAPQTLAPELGVYTPTGNVIARTQAALSTNITELRVTLTGGAWYVPIVSGHGSVNDQSNPFTGANVSGGATGDYEITVQRGTNTTNPLHNQDTPEDVSGDGVISPLDSLLIINYLNERAATGEEPSTGSTFPDVNNDRIITPIDALMVINYLNALRDGTSPPVSAGSGTDVSARTSVPSSQIAAAVDDYFAEFSGKLGTTSFGSPRP
jgi:hypothetical protein